jgi:hypothetical protein
MTPKEKAIELYNKFLNPSGDTYLYGMLEHESAKECALIAVDEILNTLKIFPEKDTTSKSVVNYSVSRIVYWVQVKQEIEKL